MINDYTLALNDEPMKEFALASIISSIYKLWESITRIVRKNITFLAFLHNFVVTKIMVGRLITLI